MSRRYNLSDPLDLDTLGEHDLADELRRDADLRGRDEAANWFLDEQARKRERARKANLRQAKRKRNK